MDQETVERQTMRRTDGKTDGLTDGRTDGYTLSHYTFRCIPAVPQKLFGSADCKTIHLSINKSADLNPFRGTHCIKLNVHLWTRLYWCALC